MNIFLRWLAFILVAIICLHLTLNILFSLQLENVATSLGKTSENSIASFDTCWDIFPMRCGNVTLFLTTDSLDAFKMKVNTLSLYSSNGDRYLQAAFIDGTSIFTSMNVETQINFTVNGYDTAGDSRKNIAPPNALEWRGKNQVGQEWVINYFDLQSTRDIYKIEGKEITENIVLVMLKTK